MILVLAIKLLLFILYHGTIAFGVFFITSIAEMLFSRIEEWSIERAEKAFIC